MSEVAIINKLAMPKITDLAKEVVVERGAEFSPTGFFVTVNTKRYLSRITSPLNGMHSERNRELVREYVLGSDRRAAFVLATLTPEGMDRYGSNRYGVSGLNNLKVTPLDLFSAMYYYSLEESRQFAPASPLPAAVDAFQARLREIEPIWYASLVSETV